MAKCYSPSLVARGRVEPAELEREHLTIRLAKRCLLQQVMAMAHSRPATNTDLPKRFFGPGDRPVPIAMVQANNDHWRLMICALTSTGGVLCSATR
ncbi:hypothetical protein BQ8794_70252 [Mesorhizobium prunaredense]|uniref:Uncharacterized protein n=1 Tax=Mesorhizobium prunaredense TaxID=1631249 RepID=A0A1R3VHM3_9HYPH|nr:hypothetical protein BQ8794_70252 [Mesorhizobium prunaredense]